MIRLTGRGSPAEDNKQSRPASSGPRCLSSGVVAEQATHTARGTPSDRRFVVITLVWILTHIPHGAAGLAESPAFRAPFVSKGIKRRLEYGRARAG